jgi:4-hydroxybenzoate polyprenyltransferase
MIAILFATDTEASPFLSALAATPLDDPVMGVYRCRLTPGEIDLLVAVCGMGKVAAALATQRLIDHYGCRRIVHTGICGTLVARNGLRPGAVLRIDRAVEEHPGRFGMPDHPVKCDNSWWPRLPTAGLVTCERPVFDDNRKKNLARRGDVVDMEGAVVARVCARYGVPCTIFKGITDTAGDDARQALHQNIETVSVKVAQLLRQELQARAAELAPPAPEAAPLPTWKKILRFTKIEHTAFSLPLLFAGAWLGADGRFPSLGVMLLIVIAATGARIFGMSFNRIFDRRIDALNPRTAGRELPSGTMSVPLALTVAFSGLVVYLWACALLGGWCLVLSPLPLIPLLGYSLLKRFTPLCHFGIGLCLAIAPLCAFVAASGNLDFTAAILLFSLFVFLWLSASDIIYALLDIDSDRRNRIFSLPAALGRPKALRIAAALHGAAAVCILAVALLTSAGPGAWLALAVSVGAMALMYWPKVPIAMRFFPISTIAGITAALVPMLGNMAG